MIGLVTLYKENYGSILQAFAISHFIKSLGQQCVIIQEIPSQGMFAKTIRRIPLLVKYLFFSSFRYFFHLQDNVVTVDYKNPAEKSLKKMKSFISNNFFIKNIPICKLKNLSERKYDFFITGSDQVWKTIFSVDPIRFLQFAPREKRIALAASFGISEIPKYNQKALRKALNGFDYISVREETGVEIVKKYSNTKVCRIADPTFIYDADEWRKFAKEAVIPSQKYILVHFLNEPNEIALGSMAWLSEQLNLDVVALGYKYDNFNNLKRFTYMDGGPWEYVSMIDHAEFVLTDSFHSSLFSINFNKHFFVFHRNYSVSKQTSRISDLLKRFGMDERLVENVDTLKTVYLKGLPAETRLVLGKERATIRDYIQKSISGQIPQCFLQGDNNGL